MIFSEFRMPKKTHKKIVAKRLLFLELDEEMNHVKMVRNCLL